MDWTDPRVELLKKLWADGLSASQIAAQLGGITRNAVVGKIHRMGIAAGTRTKPLPRPARKTYSPAKVLGVRPAMNGKKACPILELPESECIIVPLGQRCGLLDLTEQKCHWPLGTPGTIDFYFCGGAPLDGTPYCGYHCRVAYQPPSTRSTREYRRRV